jgi:signal transduction histidine kinase/PAS domain-containing protein
MPLLHEHHVISGMTVVIPGSRGPYGVLGMHTARRRHFSPDDANFLQAAANIIGAAVERTRVEDALRLARDQTEAILAGIGEGVTVQEPTGRLIYANDMAAQLTGYPTAGALLAAPVGEVMQRFSVFDEGGAPMELSRLPGRQALLGDVPASLVVRFRVNVSDEEHWALVSARPVFNASGKVEYAVNIFRDITDLKRTELAQRVLAQAGGVLAHSLDYEVQLAGVAQQVVPHLADWCAVHVRDEHSPAGYRLVALTHADPAKAEQAITWRQRAGEPELRAVTSVIQSGRAELYADIPERLRADGLSSDRSRPAESLGLQSAMIVPLSARGRTVGTMTFARAESGKHYTTADLAVAEELARRVALTADNARLFHEAQQLNAELEQRVQARTAELQAINTALEREVAEREQAEGWLKASHEQLRALTTRIESVREEERTRIAREVHDELGGALTGLKMDLNRLRRLAAEHDDQAVLVRAEAMAAVIDQTVNTVRRIATDLRPGVLDDFGLAAAIEWQLQEFESRANIECVLNGTADDTTLDGEAATALFRVFQETLTNIARHAQATRVQVDLERQASSLVLRVSDNGRGFDPQNLNGTKSLGLLGMRERVRLLKGELEIGGAPGQGTSVLVRIPLRPPPLENGSA